MADTHARQEVRAGLECYTPVVLGPRPLAVTVVAESTEVFAIRVTLLLGDLSLLHPSHVIPLRLVYLFLRLHLNH